MIVNDGSKDSSLLIAKRYQNRYPGSIVVVDKKMVIMVLALI